MREQGFRGNCDSQGKLGMCPSLAEPDSDGFSKEKCFQLQAAGKQKVFRCSSFSKMLPRCGRVAHICEANETLQVKLQQKSKSKSRRIAIAFKNQKVVMREQGFRGNCDSQGKLGMCPSLAEPDSDGFPRRSVFNYKPQANKKFFAPAIFQKCCRGVGE